MNRKISQILTPPVLMLSIACANAAASRVPPDPTISNRPFEGVVYDEHDTRALQRAYGVEGKLIQYQCALPVKRAISDSTACRVRCSDQGQNIVDVFAVDRLAMGKTREGRELLILSRTENHDAVEENGGVVLLNSTASCFFQGMKITP